MNAFKGVESTSGEQRLRKIGSPIFVGHDGVFLNSCSMSNIIPPWSDLISALRIFYIQKFGARLHSVYVRGSIAAGVGVPYVSDVDTFCLVRSEVFTRDQEDLDLADISFQKQFPVASSVEVVAYNIDEFLENSEFEGLRFLTKLTAFCVDGNDVSDLVRPYTGSDVPLICLPKLKSALEQSKLILEENICENSRIDVCRWIAKMIIRAAYEAARTDLSEYSRDLYYCASVFSSKHPKFNSSINKALLLAVYPSSDSRTIRKLICGIAASKSWKFGRVNLHRSLFANSSAFAAKSWLIPNGPKTFVKIVRYAH